MLFKVMAKEDFRRLVEKLLSAMEVIGAKKDATEAAFGIEIPVTAAALRLLAKLGFRPGCFNPFMNNVAQLAECVHCTHDSIRLIDELTRAEPGPTTAPAGPRAGVGVAAVEVPRGILYHCLWYDGNGRITKADCVIPTTQNNANIHHDLWALAEQSIERGVGDRELERLCSMLVRAYDPCISCSVH